MFGLTTLGVVHTALSLVAVVAAIAALVRYKEISPRQRIGQVYIVATILTCLTAFGISQHGGFGPPHALGILTLIAVGVAYAAGRDHRLHAHGILPLGSGRDRVAHATSAGGAARGEPGGADLPGDLRHL